MNKLKLLYDVVKNLRDKEMINGALTAQVQKDQGKIFYLKNQFEKNLVTMQTTATVNSEVDYEGKQVKHQSTTEFTHHCSDKSMRHKLFNHMHHGRKCGGLKAKLTKFAFVLGLLDRMKAEQQENKTTLVTLEITELPEDIKSLIQEKMNHMESRQNHDRCCFMKELHYIEKGNFSLAMSVSKDDEIEKIVITFDGVQHDEENKEHVLAIVVELELNT